MPEQNSNTTRSNARRGRRTAPESQVVTDYGRIPPQATDLEQAVLGALMIDSEAFDEVNGLLRPSSFYEHRNQLIYQSIYTLGVGEKPIDMLTVKNQLEKDGTLQEVGGPVYLADLTTKVLSAAHIREHAQIVAQKALARELISFAGRIETGAFDETQDVDDLLQEAESKLFELSKDNVKKDFIHVSPILKQAYDKMQELYKNRGKLSGISSGFPQIDKLTAGWQNSDLIVIAARPGMGKTAFALSMAKNIAIDQHIPIGFFSLEMSNLQLVNRLISNVCEIPSEKIRSGDLADYEWNQFDAKVRALDEAPLFIDDTPSLSVFELRNKARRMVREQKVKIIMVDYLQLMTAGNNGYNSRQEEVASISHLLKALAKELDIPVIALAQVNRASTQREGDEGKVPQLSDLRESGAIEQDADIVAFIHRPEYYKIYSTEKGEDIRGVAYFVMSKNRNGGVDKVKLRFLGQYTRFQNMEDGHLVTPATYQSKINHTELPADAMPEGYDAPSPNKGAFSDPFPDEVGDSDGSVPF